MAEIILKLQDQIILIYQLHDGAIDKYVRAYVTNEKGVSITGSPFELTHSGNGKYVFEDPSLVYPTGAVQIHVVYKVFDDASFLTPSCKHSHGLDVFYLDPSESSLLSLEDIDQKLDQIISILSSTFPSAEITGIIDKNEMVAGQLLEEEMVGIIHSDEIDGFVENFEIFGIIDQNDLSASIIEVP